MRLDTIPETRSRRLSRISNEYLYRVFRAQSYLV